MKPNKPVEQKGFGAQKEAVKKIPSIKEQVNAIKRGMKKC